MYEIDDSQKYYQLSEFITESLETEQECQLKQQIFGVLKIMEESFINKRITYYYKNKKTLVQEKLRLIFFPHNVMHLIGIDTYSISEPKKKTGIRTNTYAKDFYEDFKNNDIDYDKCWIESIEKIESKLEVLYHLPMLISEDVRIGGKGTTVHLQFSNIIRTNKLILGIAVEGTSSGYSSPKSALNLGKDKRAKDHRSFRDVDTCSKITVEKSTGPNKWKLEKTIAGSKNKKKKKKSRI